jgi:hypothetical protein
LRSALFAKANRLHAFLEYVCRLTLDGREAEINELNIGMNVFERRENYNASDDTIVRTTARLLRQRLKAYYETEGQTDTIRIDIPRGAYVPTFLTLPPEIGNPMPPTLTAQAESMPVAVHNEPRTYRWTTRNGLSLLALLLVTAGLGAVVALEWVAPHRFLPWALTPSDKLWAIIFPGDRNTLLVPADTVLLMYETRVHRLVPLDDYIGGNFMRSSDSSIPGLDVDMQGYRTKRYTAVTSVEMAAEFGRIPKRAPERTLVRFARDLQTGDLKQSNAILIGAEQNDPWVGLFRKDLNFHLDWNAEDERWHILDDHPAANEPTEWPWLKDDPARTSYSQIALVHNLSGNGYVLIVAGTSMFGAQAGSDFIFNPKKMNPLLQQALRSGGTLGTFEILLQSNNVGNGTVNTHVVATRFHSQ